MARPCDHTLAPHEHSDNTFPKMLRSDFGVCGCVIFRFPLRIPAGLFDKDIITDTLGFCLLDLPYDLANIH